MLSSYFNAPNYHLGTSILLSRDKTTSFYGDFGHKRLPNKSHVKIFYRLSFRLV